MSSDYEKNLEKFDELITIGRQLHLKKSGLLTRINDLNLFAKWSSSALHLVSVVYGQDSTYFSSLKIKVNKGHKWLETIKGMLESARDSYVFSNELYVHESELTNQTQSKPKKTRKVFIIHGRDEDLKNKVELLFDNVDVDYTALHLEEDMTGTLIEKFTSEAETCDYAVALFSPDDETKDGELRPRQNVILELGYFLGKLGKEKVRILLKGGVEIPSDLRGILYSTVDESVDWKVKVLEEMNAVGFKIPIDVKKIK